MDKGPTRYRLKLTDNAVRMLYDEYKAIKGIPPFCGLTDAERGSFEVWAMEQARERGIDLSGSDDYRSEILKANRRIMGRYDKR